MQRPRHRLVLLLQVLVPLTLMPLRRHLLCLLLVHLAFFVPVPEQSCHCFDCLLVVLFHQRLLSWLHQDWRWELQMPVELELLLLVVLFH
jgi:hypothetical protein